MRGRTWHAVAVAMSSSAALIACPLALAADPHTDATLARIELDFTKMRIEQCTSTNDGALSPQVPVMGYAELQIDYEGTSQGDPRLAGQVELHGDGLARAEPDDGPFLPDSGQVGQVTGTVKITRAADGRVVRGKFTVTAGKPVRTPPQPPGAVGFLQFEGLLTANVPGLESPESLGFQAKGQTTDQDYEGGKLIANFVGASDGPTADKVTGIVGGVSDDDVASPAFIQGGECVGPSQMRRPGDIFLPQDPTAAPADGGGNGNGGGGGGGNQGGGAGNGGGGGNQGGGAGNGGGGGNQGGDRPNGGDRGGRGGDDSRDRGRGRGRGGRPIGR